MPSPNSRHSIFQAPFVKALLWLMLITLPVITTASLATSLTSPKKHLQKNDAAISTAKVSARPFPIRTSMQGLAPKGMYVVVDTAQNRLEVREGETIIHTAVASTGSGASLQDPRDPNKGWVFETPRGVYTILNKIKNPVWVKPDWAFIEEGESVPTKPKDRLETGVLGDYALGFGNGYFIHGTLYTRLLGTNVTHGCIRLGDTDLEYLYRHVPTGSTLIIY
ncbi:MAG: L,D-transpeptidase [Nitrospirota bacterium]|nr:L,D-transpeptidase [Nitrospirota bacterium]MDH5585026.1 L,D-transpeptidase [Nitrospirota bacterium]MDH5773489.1 L,D-transpeptidase [Nitrospirota bacterium]